MRIACRQRTGPCDHSIHSVLREPAHKSAAKQALDCLAIPTTDTKKQYISTVQLKNHGQTLETMQGKHAKIERALVRLIPQSTHSVSPVKVRT